MNAHREFHELLSAALDGALAPEEQARLDTHLAGCESCRAYRDDLARNHAHIRALEPVEPPPWMAARIMGRVRAEAAPRPSFLRRWIMPLMVRPEFQVASLLLVCVTSYYLVTTRPEGARLLSEPKAKQAPAEAEAPATPARDAPLMRDAAPRAQAPAEPREGRAPGDAQPLKKAEEVDQLGNAEAGERQRRDAFGFAAPPPPASKPTAMPAPESAVASGMAAAQAAPSPQPASGPSNAVLREATKAAAPAKSGSADDSRSKDKTFSPAPPGMDGTGLAGNLQKQVDRKNEPSRETRPAQAVPGKLRAEKKEDARGDEAEAAPILIQWEPADPARARARLEADLAVLGTVHKGSDDGDQARLLRARLDSRRLPELLARLERHGRILGPRPPQGGRPGTVTVLIRW